MMYRNSLALAIAGFLTLSSRPARPTVVGVVLAANRVHLSTIAVTAGATIYDGDRLSTETGGMLRLRRGTAVIELAEESSMSVRTRPADAKGVEVELGKGTLVFSTERAGSLNVIAMEANIRPLADTRTVARMTVTGPKELRICAPQGALQFSYRGERETMAEGKSYRVILDPPEDSPKEKEPIHPRKWPKGFKIVIIGEGAAVVALGIYELVEPESRIGRESKYT